MAIKEIRRLAVLVRFTLVLWTRENINFFLYLISIATLIIVGVFDVWNLLKPYLLLTAAVFLLRLYLEDNGREVQHFFKVNNVYDIAWFIVKHVLICTLALIMVFVYGLANNRFDKFSWMLSVVGCFLGLLLTYGLKIRLVVMLIGLALLVVIRVLLLLIDSGNVPEILILSGVILVSLNAIRIKNEYSSFF